MRTIVAVVTVTVLVSASIVSRASAQVPDARLWTQSLPDTIQRIELTPLGTVVALTKSGMVAIDLQSGKQLWVRADVTDFLSASTTSSAFVTTRDGHAIINLETGEDRGNVSGLRFKKLKTPLLVESTGLLFLSGETAESDHSLVAVRFDSGDVLWRQDGLFSSPDLAQKAKGISYDEILADEGVLVLDPSYGGLLRLDPGSGKLLWRASDKNLKVSGPLSIGVTGMRVFGGRVLVPNANTIFAIDLADGRLAWKHEVLAQGGQNQRVQQLESTPKGLLVRLALNVASHGPYQVLELMNTATGARIWSTREQKQSFEGRSSYVLRADGVIVATKFGLALLELSTGRTIRSAQLPRPKDGEDICCVEAVGDRFLLTSRQNLRMTDFDGKVQYDKYFKAPGASGLAKLAAVATIAAEGAAAASSPLGGVVHTGLASVFTQKFGALGNADRFTYLFTESPDGSGRLGFSLVRVVKDTGAEAGRVWFIDRTPDYVLDAASGIVVVGKDKAVFAMGFPTIK